MAATLPSSFATATQARAEIEEILAKLPELWNRHDVAGYASHFSENVDFVNVLGGRNRGRAAVEAELAMIHQSIFRNSRLEFVEHSLRTVAPNVAVAHINWQMTGHESMQEKQWGSVRRGIITAVFVAEADTWRITAFQNTDRAAAA
ncbi:MAG TPA: SgcJ/EcaC family oxidoreductase [Terriglobales bacterium]|jgi:uncharacterized protein (TIGR02246 family)